MSEDGKSFFLGYSNGSVSEAESSALMKILHTY
jgi:hypothetical protein